MGVLSGQFGETAPAAAELCCIWAGRAWDATCAGPLHLVVAVPGLTSNVHGLKVRYVTFQCGKWCGRAQKRDFFVCTCSHGCGFCFNMETDDIIYAACQYVCFVWLLDKANTAIPLRLS